MSVGLFPKAFVYIYISWKLHLNNCDVSILVMVSKEHVSSLTVCVSPITQVSYCQDRRCLGSWPTVSSGPGVYFFPAIKYWKPLNFGNWYFLRKQQSFNTNSFNKCYHINIYNYMTTLMILSNEEWNVVLQTWYSVMIIISCRVIRHHWKTVSWWYISCFCATWHYKQRTASKEQTKNKQRAANKEQQQQTKNSKQANKKPSKKGKPQNP